MQMCVWAWDQGWLIINDLLCIAHYEGPLNKKHIASSLSVTDTLIRNKALVVLVSL